MTTLTLITNTPRDYAWGTHGGISRLLGHPATNALEAELWLGSHPASPSRAVRAGTGWRDLAEWERFSGRRLPFLLKVLSAASPLSLQAHPTREQARSGFEREEAAGIRRDAAERNYRDPFAKPEIIVAVESGFEALCGFREPAVIVVDLNALMSRGLGCEAERWRELLSGADPLRRATSWLLSGDPGVRTLVAELAAVARREPARFELLDRLAGTHPGDPGIAVALMTNHVTLGALEALWLPAGNIHAYLRGTGIELMGPSDNVLRGGLTPKHVDVAQLLKVVDFRPLSSTRLLPEQVDRDVVSYRPASVASGRGVDFQLLALRGVTTVELDSPAIALCVAGSFSLTSGDARLNLSRGSAAFIDRCGPLDVHGAGQLYLALGTRTLPSARSAER
jgi:mannose-6-phosphate isomerase